MVTKTSKALWSTHNASALKGKYHSAVAKSAEEAGKLLKSGFEYVRQKDDLMLFRKRK
ncbi:MAG: hypothetical protein OEY22_12015 [Candidatus Bathyarchaeota archaeon]|nr:hypothetical protein [Candidatus Bathyarchaeota archaeon]